MKGKSRPFVELADGWASRYWLCKRSSRYGFSLLELLIVLTLIALLLSLSVSVFRYGLSGREPRDAAEELLSTLRLAQHYAKAHATRTRVVFADEAFVESVPEKQLPRGFCYAVYSFYTPSVPQVQGRWMDSSTGHEASVLVPTSLPSGFVGEWILCPDFAGWKKVSPQITIASELFTRSLSELFYTPAKHWAAYPAGVQPLGSLSICSIYPLNYHQTPIPTSYALVTFDAPPTELSSVLENGQPLAYFNAQTPAKSVWPLGQKYRFFANTDPVHTGDLEDANVGVSRRFFDLPGIEFDPQGLPTFTWASQVMIQVSSVSNIHNMREIQIDRATGLIQLKEEDE